MDSVYPPTLLAVPVLLYNAGLCSLFVHILSPSFSHAALRLKLGSFGQAHPSAADRRIQPYKSTFRQRESLYVSINTHVFTSNRRVTEDCERSTHKKQVSNRSVENAEV